MKIITLKKILFTGCFAALAVFLNHCKDPSIPPEPVNDEELITSVKIELKDSVTGQLLNYFFRDLDGEGGNPPSQWDTITLDTQSVYITSVKFLNESNPNNIINITSEIKSEHANHIICYAGNNANTLITRTDSSGNYLLGLESRWVTGHQTNGDVTITLKHQEGIKDGTCTPGETDVEVKFQVKLK